MAPVVDVEGVLVKRLFCTDGNGDSSYCYYSNWDNWGRWVAAAVVVVVILILAFGYSCFNTRRRRRMGQPPMYGTGWMGNSKYGPNNGTYNGAYNGGPAPPYTPAMGNQQTGNTFNSNDGYYGAPGYNQGYNGQQNGIELQSPQSAYVPQRGGDPVYEAPQGPPPKKGDGIIR